MLIKKRNELSESLVTPEKVWRKRRELIKAAAAGSGLLAAGPARAFWGLWGSDDEQQPPAVGRFGKPIADLDAPSHGVKLQPTDYKYITTYNNFMELGSGKQAPAERAHRLKTDPWSIQVDGECEKPGKLNMEDIMSMPQEERIYRFRCVEAWYMVVPWVGFSLADLLKRFKPTSKAKYVAFETLYDPQMLPEQKRAYTDWPYREGLRIDEAMHPLTLLATGLYGETLPNQNGAPLRLVVPWKYGFKSIKSLVRIRFSETQPKTTWNMMQPGEYGFYSNVNPNVSHPRWSQKTHRVLGAGWLSPKEMTLMFNGYADQVASLYSGMDLKKFY